MYLVRKETIKCYSEVLAINLFSESVTCVCKWLALSTPTFDLSHRVDNR